jgi:phosphoribosylformimino-5-aminoimidazole carboxamide ribotide isomerase
MQIIPVIDLKNGAVVHAKQGNRNEYAPLSTKLVPNNSHVIELIKAYQRLFAANTIYIADLNAITGQGNNAILIRECLLNYPELIFWVDGGYPIQDKALLAFPNVVPVLGSESFDDTNVQNIKRFEEHFILSLDFAKTGKMGAAALFNNPSLWPQHIIVMTLGHVGSLLGPDFKKLSAYTKQNPNNTFIAAGGIRHKADLIRLSEVGINHALVATALHNGEITPDDVMDLQTKKYPD